MRNRNYLWASIIPLGFTLLQPVVKAEPEEATRGRLRWASPGRTRRGPADGSTRGWLKLWPKSTPRVAYQTDPVDFLALIDNQRVLLSAQLSDYRALSELEQGLASAGKSCRPG